MALLLGLFLAMLAVRPQILAIGPLLPEIQDDLAISHAEAGLLTTIPVVCMGLFAPLGPRLAHRLGVRLAIAACLASIAIFGVVRAVAPGAPLVIGMTVALGVGMGVIGALPAIVIKQRAPHIPGLATGAYSTGILTGSAVSAAIAVPLSLALGGWRAALAAMAIIGVGSIVGWLALVTPDLRRTDETRHAPLPWRVPVAWLLIAVFGLQSVLYYGVVAWLPDAYVERGWSLGDAGNLIAVVNVVGLVTGLFTPWMADSVRDPTRPVDHRVEHHAGRPARDRPRPRRGLPLGFHARSGTRRDLSARADPAVDVADRATHVGAAAALMLLGGYLISGIGPLILGLARDISGDFGVSLWILVVLGVALVACCLAMAPRLLARGIRPTSVEPATTTS